MICPICRKGELINFGLLTCCYCRKMWQEHEFLTDVLSAGLSYYFEGDINGECVIYNPQTETHDLIESIDCPAPKAKEKESMRIEEAIEILDRHYTLHHNVTREELDTAARLGIEALKSIHGMRQALLQAQGLPPVVQTHLLRKRGRPVPAQGHRPDPQTQHRPHDDKEDQDEEDQLRGHDQNSFDAHLGPPAGSPWATLFTEERR